MLWYFIQKEGESILNLIQKYPYQFILTPNAIEQKRLAEFLNVKTAKNIEYSNSENLRFIEDIKDEFPLYSEICNKLNNPMIIFKVI